MNEILGLELFLTIAWTILAVYISISSFRTYKKQKWFDYLSFKAAYVTVIMTYLSIGISLWGITLEFTSFQVSLSFVGLGILFMILYFGFNKVAERDLNLKWKIKLKKLELKYGKNIN